MSGNVQEVTSAIKDIVATGGQVPGARLSALLKARVPQWSPADFGVRSLREFVTAHVAGVIVAGRSGMDVVYELEGVAPVPISTVASEPTEVDLWRVWVSPNSPYALALDPTGANLRAVRRGGPLESGRVLLEPPGVDVHREVARAFLPSVPVDLQPKLQAVLESASTQWWQAWVRELRGTEHLGPWNAFRRQKLEDRLSSHLRAATLEQPAVDAILKTVRERHVIAPPRARRAAGEVFQQQYDGATLREIATEAVQRMSVAELRELKLPVGIVLDVLATSKSR